MIERNSPKADTPTNETVKLTRAAHTENINADNLQEKEIWISRVDPSVCLQEETTHKWSPRR